MNEEDVLKIIEETFDIVIQRRLRLKYKGEDADNIKRSFLESVSERLEQLFDEADLSK